MPVTKSEAKRRRRTMPTTTVSTNGEVLTLAEAAAYLRVTENEVLGLVRNQELPGRKLANDWRFLKTAVQDWLRAPPSKKDGLLMQIGAFEDDPDLGAMLAEIHRQRGRPDAEGD